MTDLLVAVFVNSLIFCSCHHVFMCCIRVNSKKPPHLWGKFEKPPQFGQIAEIHQFRGDSMQCALIAQFLQANTISARYGPLSGADVAK
jgi:hypothetical protein